MNATTHAPRIEADWVVSRSIPGLSLTAHLLLLVVLFRFSPADAEAFAFLCLKWPVLIPVALYLGVAAVVHLIRAPGMQPIRRRSLFVAGASLLGTLVCGTLLGTIIAHAPNLGN